MAKAYRATLVGGQASSQAPPSLIYADTDVEAVAQARRILGRSVSFDLRDGERIVFTYRTPDPGQPASEASR